MPRLWAMLLGSRHEPQRQRDLTVQTLTLLNDVSPAVAPRVERGFWRWRAARGPERMPRAKYGHLKHPLRVLQRPGAFR